MSTFITNYKIQDSPYPAIVKETLNSEGVIISSSPRVTYEEAVMAEVDINSYLTSYKAFLSSKAQEMSNNFLEETSNLPDHRYVQDAVDLFVMFMRTTPRHRE